MVQQMATAWSWSQGSLAGAQNFPSSVDEHEMEVEEIAAISVVRASQNLHPVTSVTKTSSFRPPTPIRQPAISPRYL